MAGNKGSIKSSLILLLTAFIWGTAFIGQRVGMDSMGPFFYQAFRMFIGGIALIPIYFISEHNGKKQREKNGIAEPTAIEKKRTNKYCFIGGACCGVAMFFAGTLQQIGLVTTNAGKSAFLTTLYIVLVPILGIFLKHKTGIGSWIAVALAVGGLYCLCIKESFSLAPGDAYTLGCSLFWAFHILLMNHFAPKANVTGIVCIQSFVAGGIAIIIAPFVEDVSLSSFVATLPSLLYVGVLSTAIAFSLQGLGQRNAPPTVASILMSMEALFAAIGGFIVLGESFTPKELVGCVLMFAAVIITQLPSRPTKDKLPEKS